MSSPLLPIVLRLHLSQARNSAIKGEEFLLTGEDADVHRALFGSLNSKVVDEHPILLQTILLTHFFRLKYLKVRHLARGHHADSVIVQSVDKCNEPPGFGPFLACYDWDVSDEDGVEDLSNLDVIVGPQRAAAELFKVRVEESSASPAKGDVTTLDADSSRSNLMTGGARE